MTKAVVPAGLRRRYDEVYESMLATYARAVAKCEHANCDDHLSKAAPSHPYFISATPQYEDSEYKVMVVGQETRGWYHHDKKQFTHSNATVDELVQHHADGFQDANNFGWQGTFKTGCDRLRKQLKEKLRCKGKLRCDDTEICFIPNNILKVGKHKGSGRPCGCLIRWQQDAGCLKLLREEICEYYKPTHLVFFTGPNYDRYLDRVFPQLQHARACEAIRSRHQMAILSSPDLGDIRAVRTYHPGYLNRQSGRLDTYIEALANALAGKA